MPFIHVTNPGPCGFIDQFPATLALCYITQRVQTLKKDCAYIFRNKEDIQGDEEEEEDDDDDMDDNGTGYSE